MELIAGNIMTTNLKQPDKVQLSTWIDPSKRHNFTLLYKISRDGCNAQTFHSLCDNKGPTVTVLYNTSESVYGAYTAVSWQSNGSYSIDAKAFLFKLKYNGTAHSMKFPNKTDGKKAIYGHANYGPTFGSGYDLYCFSGTINKSGIIFPLNGSATLGYAYDMQGQDYNTVMNGHLEVLDLEVYSVQERMLLQKPWIRNVDWSQKFEQEIKEKVATYKPLPGLDLQQRRILLVGQVGAGKSSYFNTVNSIFRGHISSQANVGTTEQHSLTTSYRMYEIHDGYGSKTFNFRLCDTRGLEENQGIPQVVLLTKIDEICEETSEDLSNVFFSTVVKECVDKVASLMGLPRSHILPVKNYECEVELDQNINILALLSLRRILNFVDDFLFNKSDEIAAEKMKRLKVSD
ncbi:interferon-induced protein 44-like isoform X2 [Mizuhopecten yessoensis]|uniref:interferon-induced protein 44-like isoform X2 n=1 Tax=Mizuhopecten yessoensis TaxID=6573 RepID=UPI000B457310|nr:interferon-induced protein 44-like isoform X2 [Mizuhopecten yessoensis]